MNMIKWGIIGLGNMANQFAASINEVENANLLSVASKSITRLNDFGDKYNIEKKYRFNSYDDILNCTEISSIYISTLNNTHVEIVQKAIKLKKNILCEKPIATNYEDVLKIFKMLKKSNVFFLEAIAYRTHPQTEFVIKKIKEGEIGEIKEIDSTFGFLTKIKPESRLFDKNLGGGAILDVGCYPVSFANLISCLNNKEEKLIEPEIFDVSGSLCETGVDDIAYAKLKFSNLIATVGTAVRLNMQNKTLITGTKGSILVYNPWLPSKKSLVEIKTKSSYYKSFISSKKNIYANQIYEVSKLILSGQKEGKFPAMTWQHSEVNMSIINKWKNELIKKLK